MKIKKLVINNYRILDGQTINFDKNNNYIVGKNNIGKTCTLDLIESILSAKSFKNTDFYDISKPITVICTLELENNEIGIFDDNFSEQNKNQIDIKFQQDDPDSLLTMTCNTTQSQIYPKQISASNYINFSSNRKPVNEHDLTRVSGEYKIIPFLIKKYLKDNNNNIEVNSDEKELFNFLNENLSLIKSFSENKLTVGKRSNPLDYITHAIQVQGTSNIDFSKIGYGTQFSSLIPVIILDKIINWSHYNHLDEHICENNDGKRQLNIILGLDEPEVHLHPNLQLSVMHDINNLLSNKDNGFNQLLKKLFNIDAIHGQLIIVTHSPYILSKNYNEYIRYGENDNGLSIISGTNIELSPKQEKQLEMQLPFVKSALFSDCVILVEGDTEKGALPVFAKNKRINLVEKNIDIISTNGVRSIPSLMCVFKHLGIKCTAVIDNDNKKRNFDDIYVTDELDFENECIKHMDLHCINKYLYDFEERIKNNDYDGSLFKKCINSELKEKIENILKEGNHNDSGERIFKCINDYIDLNPNINSDSLKNELIGNKYLKNKSILNGQIIAKNLKTIPEVYKKVLRKANK